MVADMSEDKTQATAPANAALPPKASGEAATPKRRRAGIVLLCAVLLVFGFAGGFLSGILAVRAKLLSIARHPERMPERMVHFLDRRLNLTPEQEAGVRVVLEKQHEGFIAIRREMRPRFTRQLLRADEEISEILTPDQRETWKKIVADAREKWLRPIEDRRRRHGPHRGSGRPGREHGRGE